MHKMQNWHCPQLRNSVHKHVLTHRGATQDAAEPSQEGVSPPLSPFAVVGVQAAAERTMAVDDGRFSSLQRLSGSASTSQQVCSLGVGFGGSVHAVSM